MSPRGHGVVRAPLARLHLERLGQGEALQLLGKVGDGTRSLPVTGANFLKRWVFIYVRHGRVTRIFMAQKFVD